MQGVSTELLQAFAQTDFIVDSDPPVTIRVGGPDPAVAALMAAEGARGAADLTAWNPAGRRASDSANAAAQARLMTALAAEGRRWLTGRGKARRGDWPAEDSLFVPGIERDRAEALGRAFGQAAIVWIEADGSATLVLTAS